LLRSAAALVLDEIRAAERSLAVLDRQLAQLARTLPAAQRLLQIPGVGVITATALLGWVPHIQSFGRARQFASWLGLTPRESSSGRRRTLGHISKRGNKYLRTLIVHGARSALRVAVLRVGQGPASRLQRWAAAMAHRRGRKRGAVALANKLARIIWAVWTRDVDFASPMTVA
jgi:transposase